MLNNTNDEIYPIDDENYAIDEDLETNTCSAYDCTGLIPSAITDEEEIEAYEELYPYLSPDVKTDKDIKNFKNVEIDD